MSLEEVGRLLGMSRQNVQLIERRALNKLRCALGSSYRGPWKIYDSEGVPEPAEDFRTREHAATQNRGSSGRFRR